MTFDRYIGKTAGAIQASLDLEQKGQRQQSLSAIESYIRAHPGDANGHLAHFYLSTRAFRHEAALAALQKAVASAGGAKAFKVKLGLQVCLIFSNCHGKILCSSFSAVSEMAERFLFVGYYNVAPQALSPDIAELADKVVFQSTAWNEAVDKDFSSRFDPSVQIIRFPAATQLALWPYYVSAPHKRDDKGVLIYRYAYADRFIDQRVRNGVDDDTIVAEYLDLDIPSEVQIDRVIEAESQKEFAKEAQTDIHVRAFIEENFRRFPVFHTPNHPTRRVMNHQAVQIAGHLGVDLTANRLPREEYQETSATQHPIHPALVDYFRLEFRDAFDTFRMSRHTPVTFEAFIPLYIAGRV